MLQSDRGKSEIFALENIEIINVPKRGNFKGMHEDRDIFIPIQFALN